MPPGSFTVVTFKQPDIQILDLDLLDLLIYPASPDSFVAAIGSVTLVVPALRN